MEPQVTDANEALFRTHHPSLGFEPVVFILTQKHSRHRFWVIYPCANQPTGEYTHAGGMEIHIQPFFHSPFDRITTFPDFQPDPISRYLDTREFLTSEDIRIIRRHFPGAFGIQILRCETALLLFHSSEEIYESWSRSGYHLTLGGLQVGWIVPNLEPSTPRVHCGHAISMTPAPSSTTASPETPGPSGVPGPSDALERGGVHGCLGLKIELQEGQRAITTVTHAFVNANAKQGAFRRKLTFAYMKAREAIQRFSTPLRNLSIAAEVSRDPSNKDAADPKHQTPVGRRVYLAGTKQQVSVTVNLIFSN